MLVIRGNDDGQPKWGQLARRVRKHASTHTETAGEDFKARILRTSPCASNYLRIPSRCQICVFQLCVYRSVSGKLPSFRCQSVAFWAFSILSFLHSEKGFWSGEYSPHRSRTRVVDHNAATLRYEIEQFTMEPLVDLTKC